MPAGFVTPSVCGRHGPATWRLENFTRAGGSSVAGTVQHHHLEDTSHLLTSLSLCPRFLPLVRRLTLTLTLTSAVGERQEGPPPPREESWSTKGVMVGVITLTLWLWHQNAQLCETDRYLQQNRKLRQTPGGCTTRQVLADVFTREVDPFHLVATPGAGERL